MFQRPGLNIVDCIHLNGKFQGSHTAFICGEERITWLEFSRRVNRVANALQRAGLKKGDKVGLLCLNGIESVSIMFGTMLAGGVIVPLSLLLTPVQIADLARDADAKFFFVVSPLEMLANPAMDRFGFIPRDRMIAVGFENDAYQTFAAFLEGVSEDLPKTTLADDDEACIIYSSGTTGVPKGIVHTHLSRTLMALSMTITSGAVHRSSVCMAATPLFANTTWGTIMPSMLAGATTVMMQMFDPAVFLKTVEREKCTLCFMVPTQYQAVLSQPDFDSYDLSSLRFVASAGAVLPVPMKQKILEKFGPILYEGYGVTEGFLTLIGPEHILEKPKSVGSPIFGGDIRIVDDGGREVGSGDIGEIVGFSHWFMKGYHNRPEATAEMIWHDELGRTFLRSGDMGYLDEDGFLYIVDRKKDMIVSGGLNVFAFDIESVLVQHEAVQEAAVIAVPHEKWGETPLALVIRKPDAAASEEEIRTWANEQLAKFQRISQVVFREEDFPRNMLGKVLKRHLREPYWKSST